MIKLSVRNEKGDLIFLENHSTEQELNERIEVLKKIFKNKTYKIKKLKDE